MKHQTRDQLQTLAEIQPQPQATMTRNERLERWAELLERDPQRRLSTLSGTEHQLAGSRARMRNANSPITVAFADRELRAAGMRDDTYGEAKRFFEIGDWQLHDIVCHCHFGETMNAASAAREVRMAMAGERGFFTWLRNAIFR